MMTTAINIVLNLGGVYLVAGLLFAVFFYLKAAATLDAGTEGTPWHFKLIIFPGVVLFWLPLLIKYLKVR